MVPDGYFGANQSRCTTNDGLNDPGTIHDSGNDLQLLIPHVVVIAGEPARQQPFGRRREGRVRVTGLLQSSQIGNESIRNGSIQQQDTP